MREIKFRQWIARRKMMHYGIGIVNDGHWAGPPSVTFSVDQIMQFTGLLDKSGKEIWEGDVYKVPNGDIGVIEYEESRFVLRCPNGKWAKKYVYWHGGMPHSEEWGVIGNIYENPELLK